MSLSQIFNCQKRCERSHIDTLPTAGAGSAQNETGLIVTFTNAFDARFSRQIKSHLTFIHQIENSRGISQVSRLDVEKEPFSRLFYRFF